MSYLHDEIDDDTPLRSQDRELTLSTGTILGIFFGLALLCAAFFGFGYSMGSKARPAPIVAVEKPAPDTTTNFNSFKPAPGAAYTAPKQPVVNQTAPPASVSTPVVHPSSFTPAASVKPAEATDVPTTRAAAPADSAGSIVVQVAAVSHQEDADLLVAALKRKGYAVVARTAPQDKLLHIQVGPFASKKDAEVMRQRLLVDGYNAIVK
jgi:DedD protein